jgi:hypothetical protein
MFTNSSCVVFIAHPGHELRIHHFLELARPVVHVLTDGSGSQNHSRLSSTLAVLENTGARAGGIFGRYTDREVYDLMLKGNFGAFIGLAEELAECMHQNKTDLIIGDKAEGYNSSHDVCRLIVGAAVDIAAKKYRLQVANYDFPLVGSPDPLAGYSPDEIIIELDDAAFERKYSAALNYQELAAEVNRALKAVGRDAFMREVLHPAKNTEGRSWLEPEAPYYETYGEKQIATGIYQEVIRFKEHIEPLARHLEAYCISLST